MKYTSFKAFSFLLYSTILALLLFGCKDKNQETRQTQEKMTPGAGQLTFTPEKPNITTATVKANDKETRMERYVTKDAKNAIAFNVRGDKLEAVVNNPKLGISFGTPRNFQALPFSTLPTEDIARKFTEFTSPEMRITPLYAFSNGQNSMVVSQIKLLAGQSPTQFVDSYETLNKSRFAPANFTTTSFKNRDIPMVQFFIQEAESGLFRIIFPSTQKNLFLQFDYTARRTSIQADMERIDPSIGSILRIATTTP